MPPLPYPVPTPIYRIVHINSLPVLLQRGALHAPNHLPQDGLASVPIHHDSIQKQRKSRAIECGERAKGVIHDYVPFYFNPRSPMLYAIHMGQVAGCKNQGDIVVLETTCQAIEDAGHRFVFSNGHGIMALTCWYDDLEHLDEIDWPLMREKYWRDTPEDGDRRRRRQAEFLVKKQLPFSAIAKIATLNVASKQSVKTMLEKGKSGGIPVSVVPSYYY